MNKGFSLVELIVVIAIMAILVGVAVPTYTAYIEKANKGVDDDLVGQVEYAAKLANVEYGTVIEISGASKTLTIVCKDDDEGQAKLAADQIATILKDADPGTVTVADDGKSASFTFALKSDTTYSKKTIGG